jgi:hypothetical protein
VVTVVKTIIVIELTGIKMAATKGDRFPETANASPVKLYSKESIKLA